MATWKKYTGSGLTNGSHAAYHAELCHLIEEAGAETLHLETLFPLYQGEVGTEQALIKKIAASVYSADVQAQNERCDRWIRAILNIIKACLQAPEDSETYKNALPLKGIAGTYNGINQHEQSAQISETKGIVAALQAEGNAAALEAMGLAKPVESLAADNLRFEELIRLRNREDASFMKDYGTLTASKQRVNVDKLYEQVVTIVNAFNVVTPDAKIEEFIIEATATANHYANVAAQGGTKKPDLDPDASTDTTPTPNPNPDGDGDSESPDEI